MRTVLTHSRFLFKSMLFAFLLLCQSPGLVAQVYGGGISGPTSVCANTRYNYTIDVPTVYMGGQEVDIDRVDISISGGYWTSAGINFTAGTFDCLSSQLNNVCGPDYIIPPGTDLRLNNVLWTSSGTLTARFKTPQGLEVATSRLSVQRRTCSSVNPCNGKYRAGGGSLRTLYTVNFVSPGSIVMTMDGTSGNYSYFRTSGSVSWQYTSGSNNRNLHFGLYSGSVSYQVTHNGNYCRTVTFVASSWYAVPPLDVEAAATLPGGVQGDLKDAQSSNVMTQYEIENTLELEAPQLFPNPAQELARLNVPDWMMGQPYRLTDLQGRVLVQAKLGDRTTEIDLTGYGKGVYILQVNHLATKLIKQ